MRDVLATLAADQDAIIRSAADGALVVQGGPGTGKTVVALHRAAYLLYEDQRLAGRGGVLVIGPHRPYLNYVADVLPSLGEDGVRLALLTDLVPEGAEAVPETDRAVAALKSRPSMVKAVEAAVAFYEEPPTQAMTVSTPWADVDIEAADWEEAFAAREPGAPHNEARDDVWESLLEILIDRHGIDDGDHPRAAVRRALASDEDLKDTFHRAWPILKAPEIVADLWSVPAYLRRCAPWLSAEERAILRRPEGSLWTREDLPVLDAMRQRLGDPDGPRLRRQREATLAESRGVMDDVVEDLLVASDDPESPLPLLNRDSIREALIDIDVAPRAERDPLAGPFGHIVVDEAQELSGAQWQMVLSRCPSRSITVVGDSAQARNGFTAPWEEALQRAGLPAVTLRTLQINYRTPRPVMEAAEPVIRAALPGVEVPVSVRDGMPVEYAAVADLHQILAGWLATHTEGIAAVIGEPSLPSSERVTSLPPELVKGLEFDLVVLVRPSSFGQGIIGAVDRYVAMTRATDRLVILE